jgi:hypothetical protein
VVFTRCCARRYVSRPYVHFLAFHPSKVRLEKVGALDGGCWAFTSRFPVTNSTVPTTKADTLIIVIRPIDPSSGHPPPGPIDDIQRGAR